MSVPELHAWQQRRLGELELARARVKEIRLPAALNVFEAVGELNSTKQLIHRIELDVYRVKKELESRSAAEESDDDDVMIDAAPHKTCSRVCETASGPRRMQALRVWGVDCGEFQSHLYVTGLAS
jgi:hypothetical protein